jgi:FkbH-like protein
VDKELKFSEIIRKNHELGESLTGMQQVKLKLLSNITVNQLQPIFEFFLRSDGINASVEAANYDSILQDSTAISDEIPVVFWELCNIKESFVFYIELFSKEQTDAFLEKVRGELDLLFKNLCKSKVVIFNKFSHLVFSHNNIKATNYELLVNTLNEYLLSNKPANFVLIDLDKIFVKTSIKESIDWRNYYTSKSLYTVKFFKNYSEFVSPVILSICAKIKKAVIVDLDNTLWGGIVGEDGWDQISISERNKNGIYFKEFQLFLKTLAGKGIILGICSKNNSNDVDEVFRKREDLQLSEEDIVIKKINWQNKVDNLVEIARELNIGTDSLVFIDDSSFEINLVNERLPIIKTLKVPDNLYEFPKMLLDYLPLFYSQNITDEDLLRLRMVKEDSLRKEIKNEFSDINDYLSSLQISVLIRCNDRENIERIAQLTQKTNQFNLTTKRYTSNEIKGIIESYNFDVLDITVSDKFGTMGLTGTSIIKYNPGLSAEIDTLLLSCRILGRNIEYVFVKEILKHISEKGIKDVIASYFKTSKNDQVSDFYESNGFIVTDSTESYKQYKVNADIVLSEPSSINYINIEWKKE